MPKEPSSRLVATSSLVSPIIASSKSWIDTAPFPATWVTMPRFMRSISSRDRPDLITWPPIIQITGRPARRAATTRRTTASISGLGKGGGGLSSARRSLR